MLGAADEAAGQGTGELVVFDGDPTAGDGEAVPETVLDEPGRARGQVPGHTRRIDVEMIEVDHVHVGAIPRRQHATVV